MIIYDTYDADRESWRRDFWEYYAEAHDVDEMDIELDDEDCEV